LERYDEAIASATAAIKVKSDDPSPYADRAFAELKCRKLEDAVTDYDKARSLGDESHETKRLQAIALSQRAVELDKEGDLVRAEKYYDQAIEFEGTESRLFNRAFLYMRTGRTDKAIEGYKQVTAMAPQNFQARAALGTLLLQRENFAEAIPVLKEASALQPGAADITFNLGFAYLREDELDQAEAQFKRALEIDPKMENAKNGLEAVEAARGHGKFSVQVGGAVEIPAAGGSAELAAKLTEKRQAAASAGSSAADAGAAASSSPAAAVAAPPPAAAGGAGASPKPSTAAPPARAAATSPEASTTAAPAASAASSATPSGLSIPSMKPKRDVRMSVAPQLLGALSASVSTGPLTAMAQPTSTEDPDAKFQLDEDGVGGVSHPYEKLRAPGPYPDGVDAGHREVSTSTTELIVQATQKVPTQLFSSIAVFFFASLLFCSRTSAARTSSASLAWTSLRSLRHPSGRGLSCARRWDSSKASKLASKKQHYLYFCVRRPSSQNKRQRAGLPKESSGRKRRSQYGWGRGLNKQRK
jgi:tetratricopeptide (TPR) repeat protein